MSDHKTHQSHTPSPQLQVPILTENITTFTHHFPTHNKHHHSPPPLFRILPQPPNLFPYLKNKHLKPYTAFIDKLRFRR
ncbi:uS15 family ribosomal protein [Paenibacillus xylanexedens]|uniref:uS15 family ribosomal protein n=1 Tax=Paenibacillus xylanexedens TaxID=528191 RepID=UPI0021B33DD6|nr:uS15 family ribosomal protein [Paenibacillus xylanexedens]